MDRPRCYAIIEGEVTGETKGAANLTQKRAELCCDESATRLHLLFPEAVEFLALLVHGGLEIQIGAIAVVIGALILVQLQCAVVELNVETFAEKTGSKSEEGIYN